MRKDQMNGKTYIPFALFLLVIILAAVLTSPTFADTYSYSLTDLGTLPGGIFSDATGINRNGQIVGNSIDATTWQQHAFIYSNGVMTDLGTFPGGSYSHAAAINSFGQVVGWGDLPSTEQHQFQPSMQTHAFLYTDGVMKDLGSLQGTDNTQFDFQNGNFSAAYAINDAAVIVGSSRNQVMIYYNGIMRGMSAKGMLWASGINNLQQIIGQLQVNGGQVLAYHPFLLSNGVIQDLGALDNTNFSYPMGINDAGVVVGGSQTASGRMRGFVYANGVMKNIGTIEGQVGSIASAINNKGVVVGNCDEFPFIYKDGVMTDLRSVIAPVTFQLYSATGINDAGQIVGYGYTYNGQQHAFLLTPIS